MNAKHKSLLHGQFTQTEIRSDVFEFARQMSDVMDIKDKEHGPVIEQFTSTEALNQIQRQLQSLISQLEVSHTLHADSSTAKRRIIHIANFAMIAYTKMHEGK